MASLADKSSSLDVEQIVGRVLRLPYAHHNTNDVLNLCYVLTASAKFQETLDSVVKGLNHAGFSARDYRAIDISQDSQPTPPIATPQSLFPEALLPPTPTDDTDNAHTITFRYDTANTSSDNASGEVAQILNTAQQQSEDMEQQLQQITGETVPVELATSVKKATMQSLFAAQAQAIRIPQFFIREENTGSLFSEDNQEHRLEGEDLLQDFRLASQSAEPFSFETAQTTLYKVDISADTDDHTPRYEQIKDKAYGIIINYIMQADNLDSKRTRCSKEVANLMGQMLPLTQKDIQGYIDRKLVNFKENDYDAFLLHINEYTQLLKKEILELEKQYKIKLFRKWLDTGKIYTRPYFALPNEIVLSNPQQSIIKMLHSAEEEVNGFERQVINEVANLDNVEWWMRNRERTDFRINGFINHYPDFIIRTKRGKIILLETKGDHLDAANKILLGNLWANQAGSNYRYFLVYQNRHEDGAYTYAEFIDILRNL